MIIELKREFYKFNHLRLPKYSFWAILLLTIYGALPTDFVTLSTIANGFGVFQWIVIIMIGSSAESLAFEYRYHTIIPTIYRCSKRADVYLAKVTILVLYSALLIILGFFETLLVKVLLFRNQYNMWTTIYHHQRLLNVLLINACGAFIYILFVVALGLLLFILFKNSALVIAIGIFLAFMGAWISDGIMNSLLEINKIWAWNPLNMINVVTQLSSSGISKTVCLSAPQLIVGNLIYTLIFALLGILVLEKRSI